MSTTETTTTESEASEPKRARIDLWDAMLIGGVLLLAGGGFLAWAPLGLLIPGVALTAWGTIGNVKQARQAADARRRQLQEERRGPIR